MIYLILYLFSFLTGSDVLLEAKNFQTGHPDYAPFYVDKGKRLGYWAVNPMKYQDQQALAWQIIPVSGNYQIELFAFLEYDGESKYQIWINDYKVGESANPPINGKNEEKPNIFIFGPVDIMEGDTIKIIGQCHSNKKIEEAGAPGGYGWSRARWKNVKLVSIL